MFEDRSQLPLHGGKRMLWLKQNKFCCLVMQWTFDVPWLLSHRPCIHTGVNGDQ